LLARTDDGGVTRVAGRPVLTVLSDSMTPTFKAGDVIVEKSVAHNADQLEAGTVITFHAGNGLVTHRIVQVKELADGSVAYRTQGDANNVVDRTLVKPDQVVGEYSWHVPSLGYALDNVRTPMGISVLIFALAMFLLFPVLAKWWRAAGEQPVPDEPERELEPAGAE
jgi:signal peptidase